ncbi:exodeoxyribonuclease VII large subunit [Synechococcus sp. CCY9201]|uniref:exodeoxyribonuclease VII large subunit n=1 Tax=Synechococcus sp. CCY9201 TaxID=174697 RepID=UPI002B1FC69D|nr:exodeoxyribonuclease VII large subunit [Synechococcus sp. CCY9201]MEA5472909.1 exodeoxyribonuclease VII large subunit [Synechococcus sp. CCY9201]
MIPSPLEPRSQNAYATSAGLPSFGVAELNRAIGTLLERGFAPRFLLEATVSRPQLKKGHIWLTLTDGDATISGVIWSSLRQKLSYLPAEGDGVTIIGRLNFWDARASLCVQVLDIRPGRQAALRQFERVRELLAPEGWFDPERKRPLPEHPGCIALLTSVPSSALADMLRTARERWPATRILVVPIPVQGPVEGEICTALEAVSRQAERLGVEALVLARGGGNREDLAVFDGERLARCLGSAAIPVVCGLGHEDDTTIADLVADYRAATPTAALVALLPDQQGALLDLRQQRLHLQRSLRWRLDLETERLAQQRQRLEALHPQGLLVQSRQRLQEQRQLLQALSPQHILERGFSLVRGQDGHLLRTWKEVNAGDAITVQLREGGLEAVVSRSAAPSI